MKSSLTLALVYTLLMALVGCKAEKSSISSGPFQVDGKTGRATGQALGITFEVSDATGVETKRLLKAGRPEHASARTEITLADDVSIQLEMLEGSSLISLQLNEIDFGILKEGDNVVIDEERSVKVNGVPRGSTTTPVRATAQHVASFNHGSPDGNGGVELRRVEGQPFYGFDETNYTSSTLLDGAETAVNFQFRLLDSRDGKDIYEITRTITDTQVRGKFGRIESKGKPTTVAIEYAGGELVVVDDEYGVAKFMPLMSPQESTEQDD